MQTTLTPEQIDRYRRDGVLFYPGLLAPAEVQALKEGVMEAIASMGRQKVAGSGADTLEEGESYYDKVFTQRLNLWRISDPVRQVMLDPALGRMLCELEGQAGFRVWHDQALIKEPFGNATAWHLDDPYWSFFSRHALSIWIALEDATLLNGCMHFIPGSHHLATYDNVGIGENMSDLFKLYPQMAEIDPVAYPMQPGDCSFHNGLTAHGAGANMTRTRRPAMTCAYMPCGSAFNGTKNILPDSYFRTLKPGDILDNDNWNPVVYGDS